MSYVSSSFAFLLLSWLCYLPSCFAVSSNDPSLVGLDFIHVSNFRLLMCGPVVWLSMWCWLVRILLRTLMNQRTSGRQYMYCFIPFLVTWLQCDSIYCIELFYWVRGILSFLQRILHVQYSIPDNIQVAPACRHLISRIFVADPKKVNVF